ncbi:hypothetical protein [Methylobacterium oryzisoli]|uniref:hypothetical protein n=1 Tax=Methylobacterium oryzisoli TaxID=3385502 RepID=UPI003891B909
MRKIVSVLLTAGVVVQTAVPTVRAHEGIGPGGATAWAVLGDLVVSNAIALASNGYYMSKPVHRTPASVYVDARRHHRATPSRLRGALRHHA